MAELTEEEKAAQDALTQGAVTNESIVKSQAKYKGNTHFDLVEVEIIKDGNYYKKGQKDKVHPTLAAILKEKGLIRSYKGETKE